MILFRAPRLHAEFRRLRQENFPLALLADGLARFVRDAFHKDVLVTNLFRSRREQATDYGGGTKKVGASFEPRALAESDPAALRTATPHMAWLALDIASAPYGQKEIEAILGFGRRYDAHNRLPVILAAGSNTIWLHATGSKEPHLHIQYEGPPIHAV